MVIHNTSMPKWQKDQKEFTVGMSYNERRGTQAYIPKPIVETLGNPKNIKFIIKDKKKVEVESGD
jgi:hypothetical protein